MDDNQAYQQEQDGIQAKAKRIGQEGALSAQRESALGTMRSGGQVAYNPGAQRQFNQALGNSAVPGSGQARSNLSNDANMAGMRMAAMRQDNASQQYGDAYDYDMNQKMLQSAHMQRQRNEAMNLRQRDIDQRNAWLKTGLEVGGKAAGFMVGGPAGAAAGGQLGSLAASPVSGPRLPNPQKLYGTGYSEEADAMNGAGV